jgi:hypothetical protein
LIFIIENVNFLFKQIQTETFEKLVKMLNQEHKNEIFKSTEFKKGVRVLFVENLYKLFETILRQGDPLFQDFKSEFYFDLEFSKKSETSSDLNELIWIAIKNKNSVVFRQVLQLIEYLELKIVDLKEMLLLISECDATGDLYQTLDDLKLSQFNDEKSSSEDFIRILENASKNNNNEFLKKFLSKDDMRNTLINENLVKIAAKNIECFKVIYEHNKNKSCFSEDILDYCLQNGFMNTFLWLLDQLKSLIDEENYTDDAYLMISKSAKRESNSASSVFNIFLLKCTSDARFFTSYAKIILEKIFEIDKKVCLFFPQFKERSLLLQMENTCMDIVLDGGFFELIDLIFSYLRLKSYPYIEECLLNFCDKMFMKAKHGAFFSILNQIKESKLEAILDELIQKILDPIHSNFFRAVFSTKETHAFFLTHTRHTDRKNILHLAAESSDQTNFTILVQKYSDLLKNQENGGKLPVEILINRREPDTVKFIFGVEFLKDILERTKRKFESNENVELDQEALDSICQRNDKEFLEKKIIHKDSRLVFREATNVEHSPFDTIIQSKSWTRDVCFYETKFIEKEILNNFCFSNSLLNSKSFECLFQRNDSVLFELVKDKVDKTKLTRKSFEVCIDIFVSNQNEAIAKLLHDYLKENFLYDVFELVNFSISISIQKKSYDFANALLLNSLELFEHSPPFFLMADSTIKNVLIQNFYDENHFAYLNHLFGDSRFKDLFDLIDLKGRTADQNILHYIAETCQFEVFRYFFGKFKLKLSYIDREMRSPLDVLIQKVEKNDLDSLYEHIVKSFLYDTQITNGQLNLRHKSFVSLCKLVGREHLDLIIDLIVRRETQFNAKYNKGDDQSDENSSLSDFILQRDHSRDIWIFKDDFIRKHLSDLIENHSFGDYKLNHDSFEALCRRNNRELMKMVTQSNKLKFNHQPHHTFDNCFKLIIENKNDDRIAEELLDYLKVKP